MGPHLMIHAQDKASHRKLCVIACEKLSPHPQTPPLRPPAAVTLVRWAHCVIIRS